MRRTDIPLARAIPARYAELLGVLAQELPSVVTKLDLLDYLRELGDRRPVEQIVPDLVALRWLSPTSVRGAWSFNPPGTTDQADPYLDLRAWLARQPDARWALAGEAAALHLGYLDRAYRGPISVWMPRGIRPPKGLRTQVAAVHIDWAPEAALGPSFELLQKRKLDATRWSGGLPALGPEALLVQLAVRPSSFHPWADLAAHIGDLGRDCDPEHVVTLVDGQSASAWQRAAYLLRIGGRPDASAHVLGRRPADMRATHARLGTGEDGSFDAVTGVTDTVLAPLLGIIGKA